MDLEELGLIGNCQFSALIHRDGNVVWCCLPRFDGQPVFGTLLDAESGGFFLIGDADGKPGTQRYLENTNVLETVFTGDSGSFRVVDFAPRFLQNGQPHRPVQLFRMVEPLEGAPRVRVACSPRLGWSREKPQTLTSSHDVSFEGFGAPVRLGTDMPLSYLGGHPFTLTQRQHFVFSWGPAPEPPLAPLFDHHLGETVRYWRRWVKHCNVPASYQQDVIRSALALKLHCFEDTGAIVAAMTTSIPESVGSERTWDYRYCWLRDSYFTLEAFRLLGHFEERESFTRYLLNIAGGADDLALLPLYRIDGHSDLEEKKLEHWPGFRGQGPVRIGNAAALQPQNDIFGEMVMALTPLFLDDRHSAERSPTTLQLVERLARKAIAVAGTPDAGIWELRTTWEPQTFSSVMCWAAADRMARIAARHAPTLLREFRDGAERIRQQIETQAWNDDIKSFVGTYRGRDLDASLLQIANLSLFANDDPRLRSTIDAVALHLSRNGWLFRYRIDDGFGQPTVAFIVCTFWLVEALARTGRMDEARTVLDRARAALSPLGLLAEDYETQTLRMWGNFPQAYSHVGLIRAAFAASPAWHQVL